MPSAAARKRLAIHQPRRDGSGGIGPGGPPPDGRGVTDGVGTVLNAPDISVSAGASVPAEPAGPSVPAKTPDT